MIKGFQPYLMIIMRDDLASMTPGRAAAQASHATSHFTMEMEAKSDDYANEDTRKMTRDVHQYRVWKSSTAQDFGTTIVCRANEELMKSTIDDASLEYSTGIIIDPTYGVRDGKVTHYVQLETCAWIFIDSPDMESFYQLKKLPLF